LHKNIKNFHNSEIDEQTLAPYMNGKENIPVISGASRRKSTKYGSEANSLAEATRPSSSAT